MGIGSNGSVSNIPLFPSAVSATRRAIEEGDFDVVHVHEPITPVNGWDISTASDTPVVGTFHAYATRPMPHALGKFAGAKRVMNRLSARIAVSEAAAWTGHRWYGGNYTIVPNGVNIEHAPIGPKTASDELRVLFIGRAEERKGLPVLLRAFDALKDQVPARLGIIGSDRSEVRRMLADPELEDHIDFYGRVSSEDLWHRLHHADVLCAPSLSGESFGMILTEAFAAGTPVIASGIAGYSDVVTDGHDGVLVPPGDPQRLAEELQRAYLEPDRLLRMGMNARASSKRYAWDNVAEEVLGVYERAIEVEQPTSLPDRIRRRAGLIPSDGRPQTYPARIKSLDPPPAIDANRKRHLLRRGALGVAAILGLGLAAIAAQKIGLDRVGNAIVRSDVSWVLIALALMAGSMFFRAYAWYFVAKAAMPIATLRRRDFASATMIGVFMSATLPARLGEPARAIALSRHTGRARENLPVIVGTIVSQTMLNILALAVLGTIVLTNIGGVFHSDTKQVLLFSLVPLGLLLAVVVAPIVLRNQGAKDGRLARMTAAMHSLMIQVRSGLSVFKKPKATLPAAGLQLGAWFIQLLSCWALMFALGLDAQAGFAASAAVLFAVNFTAAVPVTPSNIGVFQLAVVAVLHTGWGVSTADAFAYGVILQAVEMATAAALGVPALVREGLTWGDMRSQAIAQAPVELSSEPPRRSEKNHEFDSI